MKNTLVVDVTNFVALLCRDGEGRAYLDQLGVDVAPQVSDADVSTLRQAISAASQEDAVGDPKVADSFDSMASIVGSSTRRITLVANLEPQRSVVAFMGEGSVAAIALSDPEIVASELEPSEFEEIIADTMTQAMTDGARWNVARWEGSERVLALGGVGADVVISGTDEALAERASNTSELVDLSSLIAGQRGGAGR